MRNSRDDREGLVDQIHYGFLLVKLNAQLPTLQVYRVPEMATILLPGGVNFAELSAEAAEKFQVGKHR